MSPSPGKVTPVFRRLRRHENLLIQNVSYGWEHKIFQCISWDILHRIKVLDWWCVGEQFPLKYKIIYSWKSTYDWKSPSNSQATWGNYISKDQRALHLGASCSEHKLLCKPQVPWWGHALSDACGSFFALSLVICRALGNGIITPYLHTNTGEEDAAFCQFLLFCLLSCWSGCFPVSLVTAYKQTQARWLQPSIWVKIYVRNREVKGC